MNISVIAEHSLDLSLLQPGSRILDVGCRGFDFNKALQKLGFYVQSVDIDNLPGPEDYHRCAIAGGNRMVGIQRSTDPQATKIRPGNEIEAYTLETYSKMHGPFDAIKLDVEGAEYEIIMGLHRAPTKQLSIEFHLHTGAYTIFHANEMENKLIDLGYRTAKHDYTEQYGAGLNYWDSLFILK